MLGDPPAWQLMPEKWGPRNVPEEVTTTVVGARVAKTTRSEICHTGEGVLEVDVKLLEGGGDQGRRDPPPPMCRTMKGQVPLDARLMRLLIFLFKVQRLHDPRPVRDGHGNHEGGRGRCGRRGGGYDLGSSGG